MIIRAITIEQKLFARKKRKRVLQHKQGIRKILTIVLPAQEAVGGQPLAPILGQVQILVSDFVDQFNDKSSIYPPGLPLNVEISVNWDKSYDFEFLPVPFMHFIFDFIFTLPILTKDSNFVDFLCCIYINDIFKLFILFKKYYNFNDIDDVAIFNLIKSLILHLNVNISFLSKSDFISDLCLIFNNNKYFNLYLLLINELYMNSFPSLAPDLNSKDINKVNDIISNSKLDKEKRKKKNKKKYGI